MHWAKYLYSTLFGPADEGNLLSDLKQTLQPTAAHSSNSNSAQSAVEFARNIFQKLFCDEIHKQLEVKERWAQRSAPKPLQLSSLLPSTSASASASVSAQTTNSSELKDSRVLSVAETAQWFVDSVQRIVCERAAQIGTLDFDKDDALAMDFVTAYV